MSGFVVIRGWGGRRKIPVHLLKETAREFQVEMLEQAFLPGRGMLRRGETAFVPKTVIERTATSPRIPAPIIEA